MLSSLSKAIIYIVTWTAFPILLLYTNSLCRYSPDIRTNWLAYH